MEEDRERQKKAREETWIRHPDPTGNAEFKMAWEKARRPTNDDYKLFEKYAARLKKSKSVKH